MMQATPFAASLLGFAVGALGMALANRRATVAVARARWFKLATYFLIVESVLGAALLGGDVLRGLYLALLACCGVELACAWRRIPRPRPRRIWPCAGVLAAGAVTATLRLDAAALVWCFLAVACADGFAQVTGQWLGRHALVPRLSPGKTVEGVGGGLVAAVLVGAWLAPGVGLSAVRGGVLGGAVAVAALGGDLAASWVKRRSGIKDYSNALPGQGGFLDRFDSLIGALALLAATGLPL